MRQQENNSSLNILSTNTTVSHIEQMRFETKLISGFRGRLLSEYQPKKAVRKDGTKSKPRKPTYFPDSHNRHYLNLLVCFFSNRKIFCRISILDS